MKSKTLFLFTFLALFIYASSTIENCINAYLGSLFSIDKSQHIDTRRELITLIKNTKTRT